MALAFGSPFGFDRSMTFGIVSALRDEKDPIDGTHRFIQTDAAINPGNSGGPLVDLDGRVIGINTALYTQGGGSEGVGFALPVDDVRLEMDRILGRQPRPGWLGIVTIPSSRGLGVAAMIPEGPAERAGLAVRDVIQTVSGKAVGSREDLIAILEQHRRGDVVKVEYLRGGQQLHIEVSLGEKEIAKEP
jgi:S1-C subfamily serine protease